MQREPEASSSRRRLCPRAPYGLKVSAGRMQRLVTRAQARSLGEEEGARRAARLGSEVCPATLAPSTRGPPHLRSGSPRLSVGPFGRGQGEHSAVLPSRTLLASFAPPGRESSLWAPASKTGAASPRSAQSEPPGAAASQGGRLPDHLGVRGHFPPAPDSGTPGRAGRVSNCPIGRRVVFASPHLCDLRLFSF